LRKFDDLSDECNEELRDKLAYFMRRVAELEEAEKHLKGVEEALRETESHLDMAQQMAHVGSWVYYVKPMCRSGLMRCTGFLAFRRIRL